FGRLGVTLLLLPLITEYRKKAVPIDVGMYLGGVYFIDQGQALLIDLGAANDANDRSLMAAGDGLLETVTKQGPIGLIVRVAGDDQVLAPGQGAADGLPGFAAHHNGVAQGGLFEMSQIPRQVPGQGIVVADAAVLSISHNQTQDRSIHGHTATGALMCGWGS